jgi:hypothetical protein
MKDWTGNNKSTYVMLGASNHSDKERQNDDYYATDSHALELLLNSFKRDGVKIHKYIWECACGEGHLSNILEKNGYVTTNTDLVDRGYKNNFQQLDFLTTDTIFDGDILTNPPYKYAREFVEHALDILKNGYYCIMFLKIQFLEGQARLNLFKRYPPKYVYVNSTRQLCAMNGEFEKYKSTAICYCWFIWEKGYKGEPIIRWI